MGKNNCYWYPSEFYANWNIRNILCACHKYNETELNGKLEAKKGSFGWASGFGSYTITNQEVIEKNGHVSVKIYATGNTQLGSRVDIGKITGVSLPKFVIRGICSTGPTYVYECKNSAYCSIDTKGTVSISPSAVTNKAFCINMEYDIE